MRVVISDPDSMNARLLHFVLVDAGHEVVLAPNAAETFRNVLGKDVDAVILELDVPGLNGFDLCRELRTHQYSGIIMFVAHDHETRTKITALRSGADDYLVKPFDALELLTRLDTIERRIKRQDTGHTGSVVKVGDAELSIGELSFRVPGRAPAMLTPTEMRILASLMRNARATVSREALIAHTWGFNFEGDSNRVDVYVRRLRKKIEKNPEQPEFLRTVRGVGYMFQPPDTCSDTGSTEPRDILPSLSNWDDCLESDCP
ncbi:MAG TPA: response regulator transcription factor [Thermomicrobiales bacterium]|nr:response regulator transcription factor [Thermomicrobiales bacterium]